MRTFSGIAKKYFISFLCGILLLVVAVWLWMDSETEFATSGDGESKKLKTMEDAVETLDDTFEPLCRRVLYGASVDSEYSGMTVSAYSMMITEFTRVEEELLFAVTEDAIYIKAIQDWRFSGQEYGENGKQDAWLLNMTKEFYVTKDETYFRIASIDSNLPYDEISSYLSNDTRDVTRMLLSIDPSFSLTAATLSDRNQAEREKEAFIKALFSGELTGQWIDCYTVPDNFGGYCRGMVEDCGETIFLFKNIVDMQEEDKEGDNVSWQFVGGTSASIMASAWTDDINVECTLHFTNVDNTVIREFDEDALDWEDYND